MPDLKSGEAVASIEVSRKSGQRERSGTRPYLLAELVLHSDGVFVKLVFGFPHEPHHLSAGEDDEDGIESVSEEREARTGRARLTCGLSRSNI